MSGVRHNLRRLNAARAVAVSTLLLSVFVIELTFAPRGSLRPLYLLSAAAYGTILAYALADRRFGDRPGFVVAQVAGDSLLVLGFVLVTGGSLSPLTFLFALPVMVSGALLGLRAGTAIAAATWCLYAVLLGWDALRLPVDELPPGRALYAAVSHLLGFLVLGALGGVLADHLHHADRELRKRGGALAALRALHAHIVESIPTGLLTADGEGRITFVNRAGRKILGLPMERLIGRPAASLLQWPPGFFPPSSEALASGRLQRFEREWRPAEGDPLLLGFSVSELRGEGGRADGWLVVFQDLTEIATLEEQVRTRERMAALGEMAAGIAHELRNPLAAVTGCVQMLDEAAPQERDRLRTIVREEAERLNRIIKDFLEFASPGPFRPRPTDLVELMRGLAALLEKSPVMTPAHEVRVEACPGAGPALVDPDRMRQVFWNLATNALKAMPAGGRLTVRIAPHGAEELMVAFADEGHGMDRETARRYFQPFQGRFRDGSGLGAAIVYRIIEEHGGRVQILSRPGRGTEVRAIVPAAAAAPSAGRPTAAAAAAGRA
ncbi:MAG: PAS domain S-box protein [Acidobacteria bacterium]|nr:MAG: PAS domain S-box protein [Acidobacteriota bacterium]